MAYKVINDFLDAENDKVLYKKGETYPKGDYKPTKKRIEALTAVHKDHGKAFIEEVSEKKTKNKE